MAKPSFQIKHTKKGMKNLIRKMVWMQAYLSTSGIQKGDGRRNVKSGSGNKKIKLATLAHQLEQYVNWTQPKTAVIPLANPYWNPKTKRYEDNVVIPAGTKLSRQPRIFISLDQIPEIWQELKTFYFNLIRRHFANNDRKYKQGAKKIADSLSKEVEAKQKDRINTLATESNRPKTQIIKSFDFPLFQTGRLLDSIKGKTKSSADKAIREEKKYEYLYQIDDIIKKINGR